MKERALVAAIGNRMAGKKRRILDNNRVRRNATARMGRGPANEPRTGKVSSFNGEKTPQVQKEG